MSNEIHLSELLSIMENNSKKNNSIRNNTKHLSELSICGLKYRDKMDNDKMIPFNVNFYLGNAFEFLIVNELKKIYGTDVETQKILQYRYGDLEFIGHCDVYINSSNIIYELKVSMSYSDYTDIYLRQLKAYLIANNSNKGYLWVYYPIKKQYKEIEVNEITTEDINNFHKNLMAFKENKYIDGIENSLCELCDTNYCAYKNKLTVKEYKKQMNEIYGNTLKEK
jgi:hypothetical protein